MELLTSRAMAVLGIQWLFPAQLILDLAAMTAGFVAGVKVWVVIMNCVGRSMLPFVVFALSAPIIAIVAIGAVCRCVLCVLGHDSGSGVEVKYVVDVRECSESWTDGG